MCILAPKLSFYRGGASDMLSHRLGFIHIDRVSESVRMLNNSPTLHTYTAIHMLLLGAHRTPEVRRVVVGSSGRPCGSASFKSGYAHNLVSGYMHTYM